MRTPKAISDQQHESLRNLLGQTKTKVFDSMAAVEDIRMDALVTRENDKKKIAGITGFG